MGNFTGAFGGLLLWVSLSVLGIVLALGYIILLTGEGVSLLVPWLYMLFPFSLLPPCNIIKKGTLLCGEICVNITS